MKNLFWLISAIVIAVVLALVAQLHAGNVVFLLPPQRIDISLNLFVLLLILVFAFVHGLLRVLVIAQNLPQRTQRWREQRQQKLALQAMRDALQAFYEGRFAKAERLTHVATQLPEWAVLAQILGARAAQRMQQYARANASLNQLNSMVSANPTMRTAILMTRAEIQLDERNAAGAIETLEELQHSGVRHIAATRIALRAHQLAGNWLIVLRQLRILGKREALHPLALEQMRLNAYRKLFQENEYDSESLLALWHSFPLTERQHPAVTALAVHAMLQVNLVSAAATAIEQVLQITWDADLVTLYGTCAAHPQSSPQLTRRLLEQCEQWLTTYPNDPAVLAAFGKICLSLSLWGKAKTYLQHALKITQSAQAQAQIHYALAELFTASAAPLDNSTAAAAEQASMQAQTQAQTQAATHYRQAAALLLRQTAA